MTENAPTQPCQDCEHPLRPGARFCSRCGHAQTAPTPDDVTPAADIDPAPTKADLPYVADARTRDTPRKDNAPTTLRDISAPSLAATAQDATPVGTTPSETAGLASTATGHDVAAEDTSDSAATAAPGPARTTITPPPHASAEPVHEDLVADLFQNDAADEAATTAAPTPTTPRRRWARPALISAACVLAVGTVGGVAAATLLQPASSVPAASSQPTTAPARAGWTTVPGWSSSPAWEHGVAIDAAAVAVDGKQIITRSGDTIEVLSTGGKMLEKATVPGTVAVLSGWVDAAPALVAVGAHDLHVWFDGASTPQVFAVGEQSTVAVRGRGIIITSGAGQVSVLRTSGLSPYTSPRPGTVPLAVLDDGSLQWASARGEVITASAVGTTISSTPLQSPGDGATVTRWLSGGESIIVVWTTPDGAALLGVHQLTGTMNAPQPLPAAATTAALVVNPARTEAMLGSNIIDLNSAGLRVPEQDFTASLSLGDSFYGATGATTAVLTDDTVITATDPATVEPVGATADGKLVATGGGRLLVFPHTSASR